jgi:DNA-binding transcriptional MerR regulator
VFVNFLKADEIDKMESEFPGGVPVNQIVDVFASRGLSLSAATFRKYVQVGLLPRSRRVGRKGKHQGSQGLYPVEAIRRVNAIKKMMASGLTIEDIKASFVVFTNQIESSQREIFGVLDGLESRIEKRDDSRQTQCEMLSEVRRLKVSARVLFQEVAKVGSAVTARTGNAVSVNQFPKSAVLQNQ